MTDEDAYETARVSAKTEGISIGLLSGAALWAAIKVAKRAENAGERSGCTSAGRWRYLSSGIYSDENEEIEDRKEKLLSGIYVIISKKESWYNGRSFLILKRRKRDGFLYGRLYVMGKLSLFILRKVYSSIA